MSPGIHILAGENVCIQAMTPTHPGLALAWRHTSSIASGAAHHRLGDDAHRDVVGVVQTTCYRSRVVGDLLEHLFAVKALASGQEPHLEAVKRFHTGTTVCFRALSCTERSFLMPDEGPAIVS